MSISTTRQGVHVIMLLLVASSTTGCTRRRHHELSPTPAGSDDLSRTLRVTRHDGSHVVITNVQIRNDTLTASRKDGPRAMRGSVVHVPVSEVAHVEKRAVNPGKTVLAVAASATLVSLAGLALVVLSLAGWN